jgi:hypothetical protein
MRLGYRTNRLQVSQLCPNTYCAEPQERLYYWPSSEECFCESDTFLLESWNAATQENKPSMGQHAADDIFYGAIDRLNSMGRYLRQAKVALMDSNTAAKFSALDAINAPYVKKRQEPTEATSTSTAVNNVVPTFVPPKPVDITLPLINQSLTQQEQNTATISSAVIHIQAGVITFFFQLNGIVAATLAVNASTYIPCGAIGATPQPEIGVVPKYVQPGTGNQQTIVADCLCVAVNMYNPDVINYYIMNSVGKVYALAGSNKIIDIDKMDLSKMNAVNIVPIMASSQKRDEALGGPIVPLRRRRVSTISCEDACPVHTESLNKREDVCACLDGSSQGEQLHKRGVSTPNMYTAAFSKEACAAITCHNNGDKPAIFNPFDASCWCVDAPLIEDIPSGWTPST